MTPALEAALREFVGDGIWFRRRPVGDGPVANDPARTMLYADSEWKGGAGCAWVFTGIGLGFAGMFKYFEIGDRKWNAEVAADPALKGMERSVGQANWLFALAFGIAIVAVLMTQRWRTRRPASPSPRVEFLASALDRLDLAPVQRQYAEALVAVYSDRVSDPTGEGLTLLRRLTVEEERLLALAPSVAGARGEEIEGQITDLRGQIAASDDPATRETLAQSLALAERRAVAASRADAVRGRLAAQRSLLEQAAGTAAETLLRRGDLAPGLDHLRENVASLGRDVSALEAAVQEMRTL